MDTRPTSRWWPLQMIVDLSELQSEWLSLIKVALRELHQILQSSAFMVAAYSLVQRPPHQLHRVALRRPRGQGVQIDAASRILHVLLHQLACMAAVIVGRQVQLLVAAVDPSKFIEQPNEKLAVPAFPRDPMQTSRSEVESPGNPHLAVGTRSRQGLLLSLSHPAEAYFGVGLQLGLVLEERARLFLGHLQNILQPCVLLLDLLPGVFLGRDGARPPPAVLQPVQRAAERLPAHRGHSLPEELQADELTTPARAEPSVGGGRIPLKQLLEALVGLLAEQRPRPARFAVVEGGGSFPEKAGDDRVDGGARAEENPGDLGGRESVGGEKGDVHPEPATGLRLALHFDDEALAYFGSNGDILHVRPFLWWLDGFGVFTMPQRTAVCSIILCIYLVKSKLTRDENVVFTSEAFATPPTGGADIEDLLDPEV